MFSIATNAKLKHTDKNPVCNTVEFLSNFVSCGITDDPNFATSRSISLGGLNCGEPTRTTPTLTPTTLSYIEQALELQFQAESHHNQAGFEPPLIQPPSQGSGLFMSLVDTKSWQGGSAVISEPHSLPSETLRGIATMGNATPTITPSPTRRNTGGRRPIKDKSISPEEEEKRQMRRERNKMAAARCRKRRLDHTNELLDETSGLEEKKQSLQKEIQQLKEAKNELEFLLTSHKSVCRLNNPNLDSPKEAKPFSSELSEKVMIGGLPVQIKQEPTTKMLAPKKPLENGTRPRPTSLPVPSVFVPRKAAPTMEVSGVPITTPTSGMPFNFDSLMDGGTGLTPVSGPLVPSCSSQQRNSACGDLSSPDSVSTKLVSL